MRLKAGHLLQMLIQVVIAAALGLGANFLDREPLPLLRALPKAGADMPAIGEVDADFVGLMRAAAGTLLVDARPADSYRLGRIPGALSLPLAGFAPAFAALEPRLRQAELLILYCSDATCGDSTELARRLWARGLNRLLLFKGGMAEWTARGLDVEK